MTRVDALCLLSTGHLLRILIPLDHEEPPHLTADKGFRGLGIQSRPWISANVAVIMRKLERAKDLINSVLSVDTRPRPLLLGEGMGEGAIGTGVCWRAWQTC